MKRFELVKREDHYGLYNEDGHKIAATLDGCNSKLSKENCDEIFGVVDVDKLGQKHYEVHIKRGHTQEDSLQRKIDFIIGFSKAMELNKDKLFTAEDMRQAYDDGMNNIDADGCVIDDPDEDFIDTLKCIQQPTEIEVEIVSERDCYSSAGRCDKLTMAQCIICTPVTYLKDENGCLILKRI